MQQFQEPNIKPPSPRIKPQRGAALSEFEALVHDRLAYLDSVELFFRKFFPIADPRKKLKPCKDRKGAIWGYRLVEQKPDKNTLRWLAQLQQLHGGKVFRVDLALDLITADGESTERLKDWVLRQTLLKSRHDGPMLDVGGNTFYWVDYCNKRRSGRGLVLYSDKASKVTGEINCVHLELRFQNTAACTKAGLTQIEALFDLDPAKIFKRHIKFTSFNVQAYMRERLRRAIKIECDDYLRGNRKEQKFTDQYRAALSKKFRSILDRVYQGRAQLIHSVNPHLHMNSISVDLPKRLEWPH